MKITEHKDGGFSVRFSPEECCHGSQERSLALAELAACRGGAPSLIGDLIRGVQLRQDDHDSWAGFGTDTQVYWVRKLLRAMTSGAYHAQVLDVQELLQLLGEDNMKPDNRWAICEKHGPYWRSDGCPECSKEATK